MQNIFTFCIFLLCLPGLAQQPDKVDNFTPLKSAGEIPIEFRTLSAEKYEKEKKKIDKKQKRSVRKTKEKFALESNYFVDELLLSGRVTFNDPISNYVNKVANVLLENEPTLLGKLKFYTVKTTAVNAITTDKGIVFVYLGLLAQLENEAQLAFILAHEITHYKNKHVLNAYIENEKIDKKKEDYSRLSIDERTLAKSTFSKELEQEADERGLELYLKSEYCLKSLDGVFDVLQYSYLPFDDIGFDKSFFESDQMKFPPAYTLAELNGISGDDNYDDSKSTHPNIRKRRSSIQAKIENLSNEGRPKFIYSEKEFLKVRELARFELTRLYLNNRDYANAIYNSFLLLQKHPGNRYLEVSIAKALYSLSKYKNEGSIDEVNANYKKIEGASQQLFYLIDKLSAPELSSLALRYAWALKEKYPDDEFFDELAKDIFKDIASEHKLTPSDFFKNPKSALKEEKKEDSKEKSKYEKIKKKKEEQEIEGDENFIKYAFVDLFKDKEFLEQFEKHVSNYEAKKKEEERVLSSAERRKMEREENRNKKLVRRKGRALGIGKLVIVDPFYKKIDQRKEDAVKHIDSEISKTELVQRMQANAAIARLDVDIIDSKSFQGNEVDRFNDLSMLNDWVTERFSHENLDVAVSDNENVKYLIDKYKTKYFAWAGLVAVREKKQNAVAYLCLSALVFYALPFGIYYAVTPEYDTYYYMIVFDIENGDALMVERVYVDGKDSNDVLNSYIYDSLFQIKNERKTKK